LKPGIEDYMFSHDGFVLMIVALTDGNFAGKANPG
jgi:hypothetical protein